MLDLGFSLIYGVADGTNAFRAILLNCLALNIGLVGNLHALITLIVTLCWRSHLHLHG